MSKAEPIVVEAPCDHASTVTVHEVQRPAKGCEACLATGGRWVHLRKCLVCGRVGCCDSSPNQHATKHYRETGHAIATSMERGETWVWCYIDERPLSP